MANTFGTKTPAQDQHSGNIHVIIETPQGSRNKYAFDPDLHVFTLKKAMPCGSLFPYDFGYVPGTTGEDGDPLDVLLLHDCPTFTGCHLEARLLGVLEAKQTEGKETVRNDRLIAAAVESTRYADYSSVKELPSNLCEEIQAFFVSYNQLAGKKFKPLGFRGPKAAKAAVKKGIAHAKHKGGKR